MPSTKLFRRRIKPPRTPRTLGQTSTLRSFSTLLRRTLRNVLQKSASIMANRYPHSEAVIAERKAEYRRTYAEMREDVARWTSGFKPGVPRRVRLW